VARIITDLARCLAIHIFALVIGDDFSLPIDDVCERSSAPSAPGPGAIALTRTVPRYAPWVFAGACSVTR